MRRRIMPSVLIFILLMLDTAVLPVFITSVYTFPLTLALIICIGASYGKIYGMLHGMICGLLLDVLVGYPLGMRTFQYIAAGFLSGLIVYVDDEERLDHGYRPVMFAVRLALYSIGFLAICEVAFLVYQYFNTARYEMVYAINMLVRTAIGAAMIILMYRPLRRLMLGKQTNLQSSRPTREVRFY